MKMRNFLFSHELGSNISVATRKTVAFGGDLLAISGVYIILVGSLYPEDVASDVLSL